MRPGMPTDNSAIVMRGKQKCTKDNFLGFQNIPMNIHASQFVAHHQMKHYIWFSYVAVAERECMRTRQVKFYELGWIN